MLGGAGAGQLSKDVALKLGASEAVSDIVGIAGGVFGGMATGYGMSKWSYKPGSKGIPVDAGDGGNANAEGRYLFETFTPQTIWQNLALPYEWNSMTGIQQFQVTPATTMITGDAAAQIGYGSQYTGGANQWYINSLEDLIKCH